MKCPVSAEAQLSARRARRDSENVARAKPGPSGSVGPGLSGLKAQPVGDKKVWAVWIVAWRSIGVLQL